MVLCPPSRFPGSSAELRLNCGLDLLPGDGLLLVRAEAAEAQQPRSLGLRGQHHQQCAGAAEPDQKPHREARGQHGPHQGLREQKLQNVKNQDTQLRGGGGRHGQAPAESPLCQTAGVHAGRPRGEAPQRHASQTPKLDKQTGQQRPGKCPELKPDGVHRIADSGRCRR